MSYASYQRIISLLKTLNIQSKYSEHYINNLTGGFSLCFSEHQTEHPI